MTPRPSGPIMQPKSSRRKQYPQGTTCRKNARTRPARPCANSSPPLLCERRPLHHHSLAALARVVPLPRIGADAPRRGGWRVLLLVRCATQSAIVRLSSPAEREARSGGGGPSEASAASAGWSTGHQASVSRVQRRHARRQRIGGDASCERARIDLVHGREQGGERRFRTIEFFPQLRIFGSDLGNELFLIDAGKLCVAHDDLASDHGEVDASAAFCVNELPHRV